MRTKIILGYITAQVHQLALGKSHSGHFQAELLLLLHGPDDRVGYLSVEHLIGTLKDLEGPAFHNTPAADVAHPEAVGAGEYSKSNKSLVKKQYLCFTEVLGYLNFIKIQPF